MMTMTVMMVTDDGGGGGLVVVVMMMMMMMMTVLVVVMVMTMMMTKSNDALFAGDEQFLVTRQTTEVGHYLFLHHRSLVACGTSGPTITTSAHRVHLPAEPTQSATEQLHLFLHHQRHDVHVLFQRTRVHVRL